MSVLLLSTPVSAAVCPSLSVNLLSRRRAVVHGIANPNRFVELPITVCFLSQARTTVLRFIIIEEDVGFEVVFGSQWERWRAESNGQFQIFASCFPSHSNL